MASSSPSPLLRIPPIVLFIATFLLGLAIDVLMLAAPHPAGFGDPRYWIGVALLFPAGYFGAGALLIFLMRRLPLMPGKRITSLVAGGPYRFSRNPMYLGLALLHLALCLLFGLPVTAILLLAPLAIMQFIVIPFEEGHMDQTFGPRYVDYRNRVRRWL